MCQIGMECVCICELFYMQGRYIIPSIPTTLYSLLDNYIITLRHAYQILNLYFVMRIFRQNLVKHKHKLVEH